MEVILLEDVKSLGKKGELVKVNEGIRKKFLVEEKSWYRGYRKE